MEREYEKPELIEFEDLTTVTGGVVSGAPV